MFVKSFLSFAAGMIMLGVQVQGAAIPEEADVMVPPTVRIAANPVYACNCPNNCSYKVGSSCKYMSGPFGNDVVSGKCGLKNGVLQCL